MGNNSGQGTAIPAFLGAHIHQNIHPNQLEYNGIGELFDVDLSIDPQLLRLAADDVIRRHEFLRANVYIEEGVLRFRVVPFEDLSTSMVVREVYPDSSLGEWDDVQLRRVLEEASRFELSSAPLFRVLLIHEYRDGRPGLFFVASHLICDGWGMSILWHDFSTALMRWSEGSPASEMEVPCSMQAFSHRLFEVASRPDAEERLMYWHRSRKISHPWCLIEDTPFGTYTDQGRLKKSFPVNGKSALKSVAREKYRVWFHDYLFGVFIKTLSNVIGGGLLPVSYWINARQFDDAPSGAHDMLGHLAYPLPVLVELSSKRSMSETISYVCDELEQACRNGFDYGAHVFTSNWSNAGGGDYFVAPSISFNWVGDRSQMEFPISSKQCDEIYFRLKDPRARRYFHIDFDAIIEDGLLHIELCYTNSPQIETIADGIFRLICSTLDREDIFDESPPETCEHSADTWPLKYE